MEVKVQEGAKLGVEKEWSRQERKEEEGGWTR